MRRNAQFQFLARIFYQSGISVPRIAQFLPVKESTMYYWKKRGIFNEDVTPDQFRQYYEIRHTFPEDIQEAVKQKFSEFYETEEKKELEQDIEPVEEFVCEYCGTETTNPVFDSMERPWHLDCLKDLAAVFYDEIPDETRCEEQNKKTGHHEPLPSAQQQVPEHENAIRFPIILKKNKRSNGYLPKIKILLDQNMLILEFMP